MTTEIQNGTRPASLNAVPSSRLLKALVTVTLALVFIMVLSGIARNLTESAQDPMRKDGVLSTLNAIQWLTYPVHRYGGYALLVLAPAAGIVLVRLGRRIAGRRGAVARVIGIASVMLALTASAASMYSGHVAVANPPHDEHVVVPTRGPLPGASEHTPLSSDDMRRHDSYRLHMTEGAMLWGVVCVLLAVGTIAAAPPAKKP